ncbi:MAG: hypothetical protein GIX01_11010 [Candidatus Eremiobacteraeota bacterium]|nr:hypothetical protein [Candidatus Eremiobacteraeota bacterium]
MTLYGQVQVAQTCLVSGLTSLGCRVSACASIAGLLFGGGNVPALASNVAIGGLSPLATFGSNDLLANGLAGAGCSTIFGGG